tara:strand:- start:122 stop:754 length:633 start_codon:yes stop_codon:yes gene_type:complete
MKLYDFEPAANAQRVQVFIREKDIEIPTEQLNVREGRQFSEPFTSMNPFHCVPFLELDDGTVISESISICRYLEEIYPNPALFGTTAETRAIIDMWLRRFELDGFIPMLHAVRNHVENFKGRVVPGTRTDLPQSPEMVSRGIEMGKIFLERVEPHMADNEFVAGSRFSVADITAFFTVKLTRPLEIDINSSNPAIGAWMDRMYKRRAFNI